MDKDAAIKEVVNDLQKLQLQLPLQYYTYQQLQQELAEQINYLITHDFSRLISVLYRLDISEKKLKVLLHQSSANAGDIIAEMIIERQLQKIASREAFKNNEKISDDEKW
jgi:hypothetical protein